MDPIEAAIWRAGMRPPFETGVAAYEVAAALAEQQLRLGHDVIVDAVNAVEVARRMWRQVAARSEVSMRIVEVICSDLAVHRRRLETRVRDIDGFPEPTWADVMDKRAEWEEWSDERLVLDSPDPLDFSVQRAIDYLSVSST